MAKKTSTSTKSPTAQTVVKAIPAEKVAVAQPVAVVKTTPTTPTAPTKKIATHAQIAKRAFEISQSGHGGSEHDNWVRAERELRG